MSGPGLLIIAGLLGVVVVLPLLSSAWAARARVGWPVHLLVLGLPILLFLGIATGLALARRWLQTDAVALVAFSTVVATAIVIWPALIAVGAVEVGGGTRASRWRPVPIMIALLVAVVALGAGIAWNDGRVRSSIAARQADARARREALVDAPAAADNAAGLYEQAFALLTQDDGVLVAETLERLADAHDPPSRAELDQRFQRLAAIAPAVALAKEAAGRRRCDFGYDLREPGVFPFLPELGQMRGLARAVAVSARMAALRGDADEAAALMGAMHAMGGHLRECPTLIGTLVAMAVDALALETFVAVSACVDVPVAAMEAPAHWTLRESMQRALGLERAMAEEFVGAFATTGMMPEGISSDPDPRVIPIAVRIAYRGTILPTEWRAIDEMYDAMDLLAATPHASSPALFPNAGRPPGVVAALILPAIDKAVRAIDVSEAAAAMVPLVAAARRFNAATGAWPATVDELIPDFLTSAPSDPMDAAGGPFRLVVKDDGLVVYSVGPDGQDDGGDIAGKRQADIGFLLRPCAPEDDHAHE